MAGGALGLHPRRITATVASAVTGSQKGSERKAIYRRKLGENQREKEDKKRLKAVTRWFGVEGASITPPGHWVEAQSSDGILAAHMASVRSSGWKHSRLVRSETGAPVLERALLGSDSFSVDSAL